MPGVSSGVKYHPMKHSVFFNGRVLAIGIIASMGLQLSAQTDKWRGSVEFEPVFETAKGATHSFNVKLTASRQILDYVGLGFGIGLGESFNFSSNPSIPIFVRAHAEDFAKQWTPYFDFALGYTVNTADFGSGAFVINPTVGVRYDCVSIGLGYYGSKILKTGYGMGSAINLRLAYHFGYHRSNSALARALRKLEFAVDLGVRFPMGGSTKASVDELIAYSYDNDVIVAHNNASFNGHYSTGGDINLALLYPVNDNLSVGLMAGVGLIGKKQSEKYHVTPTEAGLLHTQMSPEGFGLDFGESSDVRAMIPIALRGKYRFRQVCIADRFYPFASLDLGVAINPDTDGGTSAFYWSPTVGLAFDVAGGRHSVELGLSYVPQCVEKFSYTEKIERAYWGSYTTFTRDYNNETTQTIGTFRIALGYTF